MNSVIMKNDKPMKKPGEAIWCYHQNQHFAFTLSAKYKGEQDLIHDTCIVHVVAIVKWHISGLSDIEQ